MKSETRLSLLLGLACALSHLAPLRAEECLCSGADPAWPGVSVQVESWDQLPSGGHGTYRQNNMAACGGPFCGYSCRAEGIVFSTEVTLIDVWQPDSSDIAARLLEINGGAPISNLSPDLDPSPLITFGYTTCEGLGFQGRFWEFDTAVAQQINNPAPNTPDLVIHAWDAMTVDMEVTHSAIYAQVWDIMLSGGYRFVNYEEGATVRGNGAPTASVTSRYLGNGVTGGVALRRQISSNFSLMASPRFSFLLGGETITPAVVPQPLNNSMDLRYILESKIGVNYETPICGGGVWFARAGYEVQYWNDFVPAIDNQPREESTILNGFFFAVGIQR